MGLSITGLADRVTTEGEAYAYLESLRWPTGTPNCPHCGFVGADYIRPMNGTSRKTRTGAMSERRVWRCGGCKMSDEGRMERLAERFEGRRLTYKRITD